MDEGDQGTKYWLGGLRLTVDLSLRDLGAGKERE
jgi:hypothetical protein